MELVCERSLEAQEWEQSVKIEELRVIDVCLCGRFNAARVG